jgi:hypothetical protein
MSQFTAVLPHLLRIQEASRADMRAVFFGFLRDSKFHNCGKGSHMRTLRHLATFLLGGLLLIVEPAVAATRIVHCNSGMTVAAAVKTLDPQQDNMVQVVGTCHEGFIGITAFTNLTILGLETPGNPAAILGQNGSPIFWIVDSRVQITNLTLSGGMFDVMCRDFSSCRFSGNTIENATGHAVEVDNADASFSGDVFQNNANTALFLTASRVRLAQVTIQSTVPGGWGGPGTGIDADSNTSITVEQLTAKNNSGRGISLVGGSHVVNRPWTGPFTVSNNGGGGIWVTEASSAELGGATVINNGGNDGGGGVVITGNSLASFWAGGTFTGNQNLDVFCDTSTNGIAAAPQNATIGVTNCANTY